MTEIVWTYDPARHCYDGEAPNGEKLCVEKDGLGRHPWCAWHTFGSEPRFPDSWHRTKREAQTACEAAWRARAASKEGGS